MQFNNTENYITTEDLEMAVNAAINLEKPLLIKGEPGTGKTELAKQVALKLGLELFEWNIKSTTKAHQGLYEYDAVSRLRDSQLGDKLDKMKFLVYETGEIISAKKRPIIIITSNNEKELPDAFLRRCFFHYIQFPDQETLAKIINVHFPKIKNNLLQSALEIFFEIREVPGLKKKPSTSEILDWIKLLLVEDIPVSDLKKDPKDILPILYGALLKNEQDVQLFEKLAFINRNR